MSKAQVIILTFLSFSFNSKSQNIENFITKNINASIDNRGDLFRSISGSGFEIPKNSGNHTIYTGQVWIGGVDSNTGMLLVSGQTYRQTRESWFGGPISDTYTGIYDNVYLISKSMVDQHLSQFNTPGYQMDAKISNWPGNGDTLNGEPAVMAPFYDSNNNQIYEPSLGDAPLVTGNSSAFLMYNDVRDTINPIAGITTALGLNVYNYIYDLSYESQDLENTVFVNFRIENTSQINYQDVYVGLWVDFDLGNSSDDYVGCSPAENIFFAYNASNTDNDYGSNPPAQGVIFLNRSLDKFLTYNNNSNPSNGNPFSSQDYYNYLSGKWRDGTSLTLGGNGLNQANPPTDHIYSGNGWTEEGEGNSGGDRRALGSFGPINLNAGETICFDVAFLFNRQPNSNNFQNRDGLITASTSVQNFYDTQIIGCKRPTVTDLETALKSDKSFSLYPNPATDRIYISANRDTDIIIRNINGKVIHKERMRDDIELINLEHFESGFYLAELISFRKNEVIKFVIE